MLLNLNIEDWKTANEDILKIIDDINPQVISHCCIGYTSENKILQVHPGANEETDIIPSGLSMFILKCSVPKDKVSDNLIIKQSNAYLPENDNESHVDIKIFCLVPEDHLKPFVQVSKAGSSYNTIKQHIYSTLIVTPEKFKEEGYKIELKDLLKQVIQPSKFKCSDTLLAGPVAVPSRPWKEYNYTLCKKNIESINPKVTKHYCIGNTPGGNTELKIYTDANVKSGIKPEGLSMFILEAKIPKAQVLSDPILMLSDAYLPEKKSKSYVKAELYCLVNSENLDKLQKLANKGSDLNRLKPFINNIVMLKPKAYADPNYEFDTMAHLKIVMHSCTEYTRTGSSSSESDISSRLESLSLSFVSAETTAQASKH
ncbi:DUF3023 domain-containing protein [Ehrlichia minasensis]|uniref:DUF3023 domain-containing protein n=1 Tax=Ehrlichia minasensis TaxID=1242993 RepID=A0A4Q6I6T5_9RICK|nr:DUF3023 domain-containing protein [Ehrlichia minasensis]RZB13030.1 DUF3023 domain-containing protein [Ehrlichia minasensis]